MFWPEYGLVRCSVAPKKWRNLLRNEELAFQQIRSGWQNSGILRGGPCEVALALLRKTLVHLGIKGLRQDSGDERSWMPATCVILVSCVRLARYPLFVGRPGFQRL